MLAPPGRAVTTDPDPEPAEPTPPVTSGWVQPDPSARPSRRGPFLAFGCLVVVVLVALPLAATAILDSSSGAPEIESLGFGTGGSGCVLGVKAQTFPSGTPVRVVVQFTPELAAGSTVTVRVAKDGGPLDDLGVVNIDTPSDCISGATASLEPGHYHVEVEVRPSVMPAITGDFVVES
jgi:hypothetical protein